MMRTKSWFFPLHFWNVLQAIAITLLCLLVFSILVLYPDTVVGILSTLSVRTAKELSASRIEFLRDVVLLWTIGIIFIMFDALSRNVRGIPLLTLLFFKRPGDFTRQERVLLTVTFWVSFFLAPALIVVNLGRIPLETEWLTTEDGPLEYATAFNFLITGTLLSYKAYRHLARVRPRDYRTAAMFAALSGVVFFIGFEEISWGQRIVGFDTPASLQNINTQGEFNIHNIFTEKLLRSYKFVAGALFTVACISCLVMLTDYDSRKRQWIVVHLPDPSLMIIIAMIVVFSAHIKLNELVEQLASLVILLYSVGLTLQSRKQ